MTLSDLAIKDWQRKIAALMFGTLIWWWVRLELQQELILRNLPVLLTVPADVAVLTEPPRVDVVFKGSRRRLATLSQSDVEIVASIPDNIQSSGKVNIQVTVDNVKAPFGIRVTEVRVQDPQDLLVGVDKLITVKLPIRHRFSDSLPPEYGLKRVETLPKIATVTGPRGTVENLTEVATESVTIGPSPPLQFDREAKLATVPRVRIVPEQVKVQVELQRQSDDRIFLDIPVQILAPRESDMMVVGFTAPKEGLVEVVVQGPKATVDSLTDASLRAFVDLSDIGTAGTYRKPAQVWVNARNCRVLETIPAMFEITVERRSQPGLVPAPKQ